ncbi:class F sortase [Nocardioides aestuarii]|uniref:Class F sortase n=1 Tax=Nocardioides aestuarii TaxID=252231 RepID=A0ABW4TU84_9ACTN
MAVDGVRRGVGWVTWLLLAAGLTLVVIGGVAFLAQRESAPNAGTATAVEPSADQTTPTRQDVVAAPDLPREHRVDTEPGAPERLVVPALSVNAPVVPIGAPGGVLTPPADPQVLGWWADGARPGAARGSALVTGHTVHTGGGAMDDLEQLGRGDRVWMTTDSGRIGYSVRRVAVLGKGELAERAQEVFDQSVPGRLVLITCEDWNGTEYLSNVVVTAVPVA